MNTLDKFTLSDHIARFIAEKKTPAVFQLSGGMIAFIIDAIDRLGKTRIINTRHEQAAGFAAEGVARVSRIPGFALGTSGPGATNLITAIASSFFDSIPVIYITGQVNQKELRTNRKQRQNGFQELDICEIARPITKKVYKPENALQALEMLNDGWHLSQTGRYGPVLIDIPIDLQQESLKCVPPAARVESASYIPPQDFILDFKNYLAKAKLPLLVVGGGVRQSDSVQQFINFATKTKIPYVSTLLGLDSIPHKSDQYFGFIGSYGNRWANAAVDMSDLLIVIGSRLDVRQTGEDTQRFRKNKRIIRIDIDSHELSGRVDSDLKIYSDITLFFNKIIDIDFVFKNLEFHEKVKKIKDSYPQESEQKTELKLNPKILMNWISLVFEQSNGYVVDVGQHQMWAAQSLKLAPHQRFLTSGGLGAMGFSLPASIGAAVTKKGKWVTILGDGCLQLSAPELQTLIQYNLPVAICVINNGQHGMVAQFQNENMEGRLTGTREGYSNPNFQALAKAHGFENIFRVTLESELTNLTTFIKYWRDGPIFIEFVIDAHAEALPKMKRNSE